MVSSLVFADGVRLTTRDEIPGPSDRRDASWARVEAASIHPGFTLKTSHDSSFRHYAEANFHAPDIWQAFVRLSNALLGRRGSLLFAFKDDEALRIGEGEVAGILTALEPHAYQLAHDGYVHFGIVTDVDGELNEVFVAPTKHLKVWFNDERAFGAVMNELALERADRLEFLDEYPRVTKRLPSSKVMQPDKLAELLAARLGGAAAN